MAPPFEWNQAELKDLDPMNHGLLSILVFDREETPRPVGTGFVVRGDGKRAVALTAGHVFDAVAKLRAPAEREHLVSSALDIDKERVRVASFEKGGLELAVVEWAVWDYATDIAFFGVRTQTDEIPDYFGSKFLLTDEVPKINDEVAVLGYRGMATKKSDESADNWHRFQFQRELILRRGRVTAIHPSGHRLCKGPCIETTIPVFPGMSGGPVMRFAPGQPIEAFGLVTADFNADDVQKNDRTVAGSSMITVLQAVVKRNADGTREIMMQMENALSDGELPPTTSDRKYGVRRQ